MLHDEIRANINEITGDLIRRRANRLVRQPALRNQDRDDLQQTLLAHLFQRLPAFDPAKGTFRQFAATVIHRFGKNLLRDERAGKRNPRSIGSLDTTVATPSGDRESLANTISGQQGLSPVPAGTAEDRMDLALDMAEVLGELSPELREFAECLKRESLSDFARNHGTARTTLYTRIGRLRQCFEEAGLREYFKF